MELIITKNGHVFNRCGDDETDGEYALVVLEDSEIPEMPENPPKGKQYELDYVDGNLAWIQSNRPLTIEERVEDIEEKQNAWKPDEVVNVGDRRYYHEAWYTCIQYHTTQADWEPDITPALWRAD